MRTRLPNPKYRDPQKRIQFYDQVLDRVSIASRSRRRGLQFCPAVHGARQFDRLPDPRPRTVRTDALFRIGTNDYLKILGVTLKEGRLFESTDRANTEPVIIINETSRERCGRMKVR